MVNKNIKNIIVVASDADCIVEALRFQAQKIEVPATSTITNIQNDLNTKALKLRYLADQIQEQVTG